MTTKDITYSKTETGRNCKINLDAVVFSFLNSQPVGDLAFDSS